MKILLGFLGGVIGLLFLASCDFGPSSSYGFTLPEGNPELGKRYL